MSVYSIDVSFGTSFSSFWFDLNSDFIHRSCTTSGSGSGSVVWFSDQSIDQSINQPFGLTAIRYCNRSLVP